MFVWRNQDGFKKDMLLELSLESQRHLPGKKGAERTWHWRLQAAQRRISSSGK
jgi:hypothetical protein